MFFQGVQSSPVISIPQKGVVPPPSPARRNLFGSKTGDESSEITHTPASTVTIATSAALQTLGGTKKQQSTTAVVLPPKSGKIKYYTIFCEVFYVFLKRIINLNN